MNQQIFNYIDKSTDTIVELQTELTKRPALSPEYEGEGELDKAIFLETWLKNKGIIELERYDAPDSRVKGGIRPNIVVTIAGKSDTKRLWIISHLDVVPPGELDFWKGDPWTMIYEDGKLIGRGVEDNQHGLCASVLALLSLVKCGIMPPHTVKLLFVSDEETGNNYGIKWLLKERNLFRKDDMVLVPDSGDPKGETIEIAEKSGLRIKFMTKGIQTHASRPDLGVNAYLAGADLTIALHYGLSEKFSERDPLFQPDYSTFQPTKKEVNVINVNTIPGEDVFYMDMRILPQHNIEDVLEEVNRIKKLIEEKHNVTITYTYRSGKSKATSHNAPIVKLLSKAIKDVYDIESKVIGIGGGTVAAALRNEGLTAVVCGRIHDTAHKSNEYTLVENILGDAKVMALLMLADKNEIV